MEEDQLMDEAQRKLVQVRSSHLCEEVEGGELSRASTLASRSHIAAHHVLCNTEGHQHPTTSAFAFGTALSGHDLAQVWKVYPIDSLLACICGIDWRLILGKVEEKKFVRFCFDSGKRRQMATLTAGLNDRLQSLPVA